MDFVILKVNGQDVSNSSHEDAVRCFQSAQEPIIVEVLRRQPAYGQRTEQPPNKREEHMDDSSSSLVSTAVQTDWAGLLEPEEGDEDEEEEEEEEEEEGDEEEEMEEEEEREDEEDGEEEEEEEEEDGDGGGLLLPISLGVDGQPNDSFEDFLAHDMDFEEVTLRKAGSAEKLGLTVCYSSGSGSEDADTEVYISEIVPESLAARDGRLREGDQILRVNGKDVANKEQTENLFAETKSAVTILVSRCLYQEDEYEERRAYRRGSPSLSPEHLPSYQNSLIEQLIRQQQQQQQQQQQTEERTKDTDENCSTLRPPPPPPPPVPSHTSQPNAFSASNTSSSTCSSHTSQKSTGRNAASPARHPADHDPQRKQWMQDCSKKMEGLCVRGQQPPVKLADAYSNHVWSETEHIYETIPESDSEPIYSSPYEHRHHHHHHHHHHWNSTHANHASSNAATLATGNVTIVPSPPNVVPPTTTANNATIPPTLIQGNQQTGTRWYCSSKSNSSGEEKDSSSAYNTGESCNSNPLTLELHRGERDHHTSTLVLCPPKTSTLQQQQQQQQQHQQQQQQQQRLGCICHTFTNKQQTRNQSNRRASTSHRYRERAPDPTNASSTGLPADTMYTNMANLQQTMLLQQQLFKQALERRNSTIAVPRKTGGDGGNGSAKKSRSHGNFQAPNLTRYQFVGSQQVCGSNSWIPPEDKANEVQMEWKVKRRADGTRYIARRPVRNRILRNRAIKISEERAGHSTEDDTMSEVKVGRYWTKEERKRQLERARERKQRQQELQLQQQQQQQLQLQQTNELLACEHGDDKLAKRPLNIVELSHKKMARKKNTLDDFTTVQEMLVHGNRIGGSTGPGTGGKLMGLLSVTTV